MVTMLLLLDGRSSLSHSYQIVNFASFFALAHDFLLSSFTLIINVVSLFSFVSLLYLSYFHFSPSLFLCFLLSSSFSHSLTLSLSLIVSFSHSLFLSFSCSIILSLSVSFSFSHSLILYDHLVLGYLPRPPGTHIQGTYVSTVHPSPSNSLSLHPFYPLLPSFISSHLMSYLSSFLLSRISHLPLEHFLITPSLPFLYFSLPLQG